MVAAAVFAISALSTLMSICLAVLATGGFGFGFLPADVLSEASAPPFTCKIGLDCAAKLWGKLMELLL